MKERIITLLNEKDLSLAWEDIKDRLDLHTREEYEELSTTLQELVNDFILHYTSKHKYMLFENSHLTGNTVKGIYSAVNNGYGFVRIDDDKENDIFIHINNSMGAVNDDVVLVEKYASSKEHKAEGKIIKILQRTDEAHVGTVKVKDNKIIVVLDNKKFKDPIFIRDETKEGLVEGHKVLVKMLNKGNANDLSGTVTKVIGHINEPGIDVKSILYENGFSTEFSPEVLEELKYIPDSLTEEEIEKALKKNRRDLRHLTIFTIDGKKTKDVDDAVSLEKLPNGNYRLGVHIANVSHYVKEGTALFNEAYAHGTSVYVGDTVNPELPPKLSNGICSLNEKVDRFARTTMIEFDSSGKRLNTEIFLSVINSRKKMNYDDVNSVIEKGIVPEGYEPFKNDLLQMKDLAATLRKMREARGAIDFDTDEIEIIFDEKGVPCAISKRYRGLAEKLIEEFMIASNEACSSFIEDMGLPSIYRVHDVPDITKIKEFLEYLKTLGIKNTINIKKIYPKTIQELLNSLRNRKEFPILSNLLLRCMPKAIYSAYNVGHFAVASKSYSHETSPIRRLADLILHTLMDKYLEEGKIDEETISYYERVLPIWALQASNTERSADMCEREGDKMFTAQYMEQHIGEEFHGMIVSIAGFGMFVRLDNLIEGLVSIDELDGPYTFNSDLQCFVDKNKKICYRMGDEVIVKVIAASKENRTIDFKVIKRIDNNEKDKPQVKVKVR